MTEAATRANSGVRIIEQRQRPDAAGRDRGWRRMTEPDVVLLDESRLVGTVWIGARYADGGPLVMERRTSYADSDSTYEWTVPPGRVGEFLRVLGLRGADGDLPELLSIAQGNHAMVTQLLSALSSMQPSVITYSWYDGD